MRRTVQRIQAEQPSITSFIIDASTPSGNKFMQNQISDNNLFACINDAPSNIERDLESGKSYWHTLGMLDTLKSGYPPRYGTCDIGLYDPDCLLSVS